NRVQPYCRLAIITMQTRPKTSCPQRVASDAVACSVRTFDDAREAIRESLPVHFLLARTLPIIGALGTSLGVSMRPAWWACYKVFQTAQRLWRRTSIKILSKTLRSEVVKCNLEDANSPPVVRRPASEHDGGYPHRPAT